MTCILLTLSSACTTRCIWRRKNTQHKKRSRGEHGMIGWSAVTPGAGPIDNSLESPSCDSSVGMDAAHDFWGNMRDGGLMTDPKEQVSM